jgi:hypothetical protein
MYYFQPSHAYFLSPHLLDKFTFMLPVILILHNKHLFFLVEILSRKVGKHAHMYLFKNNA